MFARNVCMYNYTHHRIFKREQTVARYFKLKISIHTHVDAILINNIIYLQLI